MSEESKKSFSKFGKLAGIIISSWAILAIVWTIFTWSYEVRADIDVNAKDVESNKTNIRELKEIADSLAKLHEKQQTEEDLLKALCRTKQLSEDVCTSKGFVYGN